MKSETELETLRHATHICRQCRCLWKFHGDAWQALLPPGPCCDNKPMEEGTEIQPILPSGLPLSDSAVREYVRQHGMLARERAARIAGGGCSHEWYQGECVHCCLSARVWVRQQPLVPSIAEKYEQRIAALEAKNKELEEANETGFQNYHRLRDALARMAKDDLGQHMCDNDGQGCPACELAEQTLTHPA